MNLMQWKYNLFKRKVDNFVKTIQWLLMLSFLRYSILDKDAKCVKIEYQSAVCTDDVCIEMSPCDDA